MTATNSWRLSPEAAMSSSLGSGEQLGERIRGAGTGRQVRWSRSEGKPARLPGTEAGTNLHTFLHTPARDVLHYGELLTLRVGIGSQERPERLDLKRQLQLLRYRLGRDIAIEKGGGEAFAPSICP